MALDKIVSELLSLDLSIKKLGEQKQNEDSICTHKKLSYAEGRNHPL